MASTTTKQLIEKITARVFCQLTGGGNPVTIFKSSAPLKPSRQSQLAKTCAWESVCVSTTTTNQQHNDSDSENNGSSSSSSSSSSKIPSMAFYMPTGEQVSFCAHAAMGAALQLAPSSSERKTQQSVSIPFSTQAHADDAADASTRYQAIAHEHDIVSLDMTDVVYTETALDHPPVLQRILRDCFGLESSDLTVNNNDPSAAVTTFRNCSVARPKTLVYVNSLQALHAAKPPTAAAAFATSCDAIASTGLYLYSSSSSNSSSTDTGNDRANDDAGASYECRQFPRASGYPEDPATGIAAAALAVSLHQKQLQRGNNARPAPPTAYKFYQGTAMGHPSLIMVENLRFHNNRNSNSNNDAVKKDTMVSFRLLGRVEVDERETLSVDQDDDSDETRKNM